MQTQIEPQCKVLKSIIRYSSNMCIYINTIIYTLDLETEKWKF